MNQSNNPKTESSEEGYILVPKSWLQSISDNQKKILSLLENGAATVTDGIGDYISEVEAKKLLGRKTTWFWNMRTCGRLAFAKVGNKVFYDKNDIIKLLKDNTQNNNH